MSEYRLFLLHKVLVLAINLLVLVAVFVSMYIASLYPEDFNATFFTTIFSLLVPTGIIGFMGRRFLLRRQNGLL